MTNKESTIAGLGDLLSDSLLNESELQRAEIVFATNDLVARLGKMIEDLSKMGTDDIMPLVDGLRDNFGSQVAEVFSKQSEVKIQGAADGIDSMKSLLDLYRERFEGRISDEDSVKPLDLSDTRTSSMDDFGAEESGLGMDMAAEPGLDDLEAEDGDLGEFEAEAGSEEALGRKMKESIETKVVNISGKKIKLTLEQVAILHKAKKLTEKIKLLHNIVEEVTEPITALLNIRGKKIRITENQFKALVFAKNFKKRVDERGAKIVRLSESQAFMLNQAKNLTQKISELLEKPSVVKKIKKYDDVGKSGRDSKKIKKPRNRRATDPESVATSAEWMSAIFTEKEA